MAVSPLRYLLLLLERILGRIKTWSTGTFRALSLLLRRILVRWGLLTGKIDFRGRGGAPGEAATAPSDIQSTLRPPDSDGGAKLDSTFAEKSSPTGVIIPYTIVKDGESISLKGAAFSLNPYSNSRKGAGSAQSLQAQRSSHNLSVIHHNASRSSFLGSEISHSLSTKSEDFVFQVQRSPTSPYGPHRQFSMSEPRIGSPTSAVQRSFELHTEPIRIPSGPSDDRIPETEGPPPIEMTRSFSPAPRFLDNQRITPVMPESTRRYDRRDIVPMNDYDIRIQPVKLNFTEPRAPDGWKKFIHPEGARYFYNEDKRVYTEVNLFDKKLFSQVTEDIAEIRRHIVGNEISMPDGYVMFIDTEWSEDNDFKGYKSAYYFIHHNTRSIFFLDEFLANQDTMSGFAEVWGCRTDMHLGHEIEAQYWYFVQLYPDCLALDSAHIAELRDVTLHFIGDNMSSAYSISPYHSEDLHKILGLTNSLEKNVGKKCVGATSLLGEYNHVASYKQTYTIAMPGRFMYLFAHSRFQNFHGEGCARLERDVSVHGRSTTHRTWLVKTLSPILFSAPDVHLKLLRKMYVDGILKLAVWETSVKHMNEEWQEFILFATVLLNANVAFLAIQSNDTPEGRPTYRSSAQIASYLSVAASIGSIILGLLLIRQHRTKHKETANHVSAFLARREHQTLGLETLAILHSLPYALLMWGMVAFLAAFCLLCFDRSNTTTRTITASAFVAMGILIVWCIWSGWETQPPETPSAPPEVDELDEKASHMDIAGSSRPATISDVDTRGGARRKWSWMAGLKILDRFRKASLDSQRTVV